MTIKEEAAAMKAQLSAWRRDLHQIPETDLTLPKTMAYVEKELEKMGIAYTAYEDISCITGMVGQGEKCLLLRGDMDGLPGTEKSGESFSSTNGCMHACGHDMHAATMLGAAKLLKAHEAELKCRVKLLFQSGEETFHGARAAIEAGVLENPKVDAAYAMHVFAGIPVGEMHYELVPMGAVYGFKITLTGKGGHGSQPENCIDPINAAVQVYLALQSLIARECSPSKEAALTIGQLSGGQAANAIPDTAVLQGTLRTFEPELRSYLIRRISEMTEMVAKTYRCGYSLEVINDVPSVQEDKDFSDFCVHTLEENHISEKICKDLHVMGSEDFALYSEKVPGCYLVSGAGVSDRTRWRGQHNPEIVFNEDALVVNAASYAQIALNYK